MATTTFSGPIKTGTIRDTTGTTVGTNVANVGSVVMAQSAAPNITGASQLNQRMAIVPANSQIVDVILNVTTVEMTVELLLFQLEQRQTQMLFRWCKY